MIPGCITFRHHTYHVPSWLSCHPYLWLDKTFNIVISRFWTWRTGLTHEDNIWKINQTWLEDHADCMTWEKNGSLNSVNGEMYYSLHNSARSCIACWQTARYEATISNLCRMEQHGFARFRSFNLFEENAKFLVGQKCCQVTHVTAIYSSKLGGAQNWAELKTKRVSNCRQNFFQVPAKTFRFPVQLVRGDLVTSGTLVPLGVIITDNPIISCYRACVYRIK